MILNQQEVGNELRDRKVRGQAVEVTETSLLKYPMTFLGLEEG